MKVTLKDIAKETGFSISTVSRVLNGSDKISAKTRRQIVQSAKRLNYPIYNNNLNGNSGIETYKVFLVVSGFHEGEFYASFFDGINRAAEKNNIRLSLVSINKKFEDLVNIVKDLSNNQKYDGMILFTPELARDDYSRLQSVLPKDFPVISNGLIENPFYNTVSFDGYSGGYLAAEHFMDKGYQKSGIIRGPFQKAEARYRANGFRDCTMQSSNLELIWEYNGDFTFESGIEAFNSYKESEIKPRAVFACNDAMCHGFMGEAIANGYSFPDDIAIIGFDDLPICERHRPSISSVHTAYDKLGSVTMQALRDIISRPNRNKRGVLSLVPVELMARNSS